MWFLGFLGGDEVTGVRRISPTSTLLAPRIGPGCNVSGLLYAATWGIY